MTVTLGTEQPQETGDPCWVCLALLPKTRDVLACDRRNQAILKSIQSLPNLSRSILSRACWSSGCRRCGDGPAWGAQAFLQRSAGKNTRTKRSPLSRTVNHDWVYHRTPDNANMSQEGKLKVSPTHGSKNNIVIASFTGTGVCRGGNSQHYAPDEGSRRGLLTLGISQRIIAWMPEHEIGGSANRLGDTARGRNQIQCLFIGSLPPPCPCLSPRSVLPSPCPPCRDVPRSPSGPTADCGEPPAPRTPTAPPPAAREGTAQPLPGTYPP